MTEMELTRRQGFMLRRLADASKAVMDCATTIRNEMDSHIEHITAGQHCGGMSHQRPFDLHQALVRREQMLIVCASLECDPAAIQQASTGVW